MSKRIEELEKKRLKEWFYKKHSWDCYLKAHEEMRKKKNKQSFFKRLFYQKGESEWELNRTYELLDKLWKQEGGE